MTTVVELVGECGDSVSEVADVVGPPLLRPTAAEDPLVAARQSFDCIRLIAHRQSRGELPIGVDTLRTLAHVGALTSMHAHAIFAAAATRQPPTAAYELERLSQSLSSARRSWSDIDAAVAGCASVTRSPQLLIREAEVLNTSLSKLTVTLDNGQWLAPERMLGDREHPVRLVLLARHIAERLPDLSRCTTAIASQLNSSGALLAPTRERDDIDHPYRWAPVTAERCAAIRSAATNAHQAARDANATGLNMLLETHSASASSQPSPLFRITIQGRLYASAPTYPPSKSITY